jgi:hypothetical protein
MLLPTPTPTPAPALVLPLTSVPWRLRRRWQ